MTHPFYVYPSSIYHSDTPIFIYPSSIYHSNTPILYLSISRSIYPRSIYHSNMPLSQTSLLTCLPHWLTKALGHSPVKRSGRGPVGQDPCHAVSEPGWLPIVDVAKIGHTQRQQVQRVVHQNVVPHHTGLIQVSNMDIRIKTQRWPVCVCTAQTLGALLQNY